MSERRERKNFLKCKSRIALENGFREVIHFVGGTPHSEMLPNYKIECANNPEGKWTGPLDSLSERYLEDPKIAWQLGCETCKLVEQKFIEKSSGSIFDTNSVEVVIMPRGNSITPELPG
jgi:hypothetical protein